MIIHGSGMDGSCYEVFILGWGSRWFRIEPACIASIRIQDST